MTRRNTEYGRAGAYVVERSPGGYFRLRIESDHDEYLILRELDELIALLQRAREEPR